MTMTGMMFAASSYPDIRRRSQTSEDQKIYRILCECWRRCHGWVPRRLWQISAR